MCPPECGLFLSKEANMTYLESITYQAGRFLELSQYVLKNAFRVAYLYCGSQKLMPYTKGEQALYAAESQAREALSSKRKEGSEALLSFFQNKGLSEKDLRALTKMLAQRDYLESGFFLDYGPEFAKEEVTSYERAIHELEAYCQAADDLNVSLASAAEKLSSSFH